MSQLILPITDTRASAARHHAAPEEGLPTIPREVDGDDWTFLRRRSQRPSVHGPEFRVVDLFAGCGGMSLGVREAMRAAGREFVSTLAVDFDPHAIETYRRNFGPERALCSPVDAVFDGGVGSRLTKLERETRRLTGITDLLIGGPPCQGHSDLNNYARRNDPKNGLYYRMARAAEVLEPHAIMIENVSGAAHDKGGVVQRTEEHLNGLGYHTILGVLDSYEIGAPQRRRRLFLLAARHQLPALEVTRDRFKTEARDVRWAIGDLVDVVPRRIFDQPAISAKQTRARVNYLFDHDLFDLPDCERPPCHRDGAHSYNSIYGRLDWERPSQTITSGFYSMCMGRYVHPSLRRTLTAHEAARLQFFPDFFDFSAVPNRTSLARVIGNAVPMKLSYVATAALALVLEARR